MSSNLHTFLNTIGAKLTHDSHCELTNQELSPQENFITPLTHYGFLSITGPDTAKFLQGQTTCDVTHVDDNNSLSGAYCTPKGRLISNFHIARSSTQTYLLRMRRQIVNNTKTVLSKYIVFSKAEQTDISDEYIALGLYGPAAKAAIQNLFDQCPKQKNSIVKKNNNLAIQLDKTGLRYECWIQFDNITEYWQALSNQLTPCDSARWEQLTIQLGLGDITEDTVDTFIPQMLNYQVTGEISFTKGCYTGQEIVARMHYRGKSKRQLYRIQANLPLPLPGTDLYKSDKDQSIGNIVNAIKINDDTYEALAVITIKESEHSIIVGTNKQPIKILSLPYAINTKDG